MTLRGNLEFGSFRGMMATAQPMTASRNPNIPPGAVKQAALLLSTTLYTAPLTHYD
jgi:hypothetical protein